MIHNNQRTSAPKDSRMFRPQADRPLAMLRECPAYEATPLLDLGPLAGELGIGSLLAKDESQRMRLGSFKALGATYAVAQIIADTAGTDDLTSPEAKAAAEQLTFITASAGNHGLSLAAGARIFGARAVIVLSNSVPEGFAARIRSTGAEVVRVEGSYEDSVAHAISTADGNGWLLLADGSWEGYVERPALVMEGYTVLAEECRKAFAENGAWPTHLFLQAGVGGLAASAAAHIREFWAEQPEIIVVEPDAAPCLVESVKAGHLVNSPGPLSNMGRLDCKDASLIAFEALKGDADTFVTISDDDAVHAVETLARHGISTTPSGGAAIAAIKATGPGETSRCLVIVSEGPEDG